MGLAIDKTAKVEHHTLSIVTLARQRSIGMLYGRQLLLVPLPFALQFLGDLLLENQSLKSIVSLLLCARQTKSKTGQIILLLVNKASETAVLPLMALDLDLELGRLFGKLLGKCLEFEELLQG